MCNLSVAELARLIHDAEHEFVTSAEDELQSEGQKIVGQIVTMSVEIIRGEWLRVQRGV